MEVVCVGLFLGLLWVVALSCWCARRAPFPPSRLWLEVSEFQLGEDLTGIQRSLREGDHAVAHLAIVFQEWPVAR